MTPDEKRRFVELYTAACEAELEEVEAQIERGDLGEPISAAELKRQIRAAPADCETGQ